MMDEERKNQDDFFDDDGEDTPSGVMTRSANPYVIPGAILLAGIMIAGAIAYTGIGSNTVPKPNAAAVGQGAGGSIAPDPASLPDDDPFLGSPEAPVTVVEFGDFQCPFCGRFAATIERQLVDTYVKAGTVKFVYRDFAFLGPESEWAAGAAQCAHEQGKYWQYHDYLFSHQNGENQGAFTKDNLKHFAVVLGLDGDRFNACLDADRFAAEVRKDTADGRAAGVSGTPSSFINGHMLSGALPFEEFAKIIDAELHRSR